MGIFNNLYKEGPGVSKNEKELKGIFLFLWIVRNNFFKLIILNFMFIFSCIPIITIGPAVKAISKITMDLARQTPTSPLSDYWYEFKQDFLKSMIIGISVNVIVTAISIAIYYCFSIAQSGDKMMLAFTGILSLVLLYVLAASMYVYKSLGTIDLPLGTIVKNALLLVMMTTKQLFLVIILVVIPTAAFIIFINIGIPVFAMWQFVYNSLVTSIISWGVFKKSIVKEETVTTES